MTARPTCTIAIPVYKRLTFVADALRSVAAQDLPGVELLVVDDGSPPEVWDELRRLVPPGVRLERNEKNLGLFGNWNRCLSLAEGRYFGVLCSDDELEPGYLRSAVAALDESPRITLASTRGTAQTPAKEPLGSLGDTFAPGVYEGAKAIPVLLDFYVRTGINPFNYPSGVLVRTDAARAAGGFDVTMRHIGDLDFFLRTLQRGDLALLAQGGCRVTMHPEQAGASLSFEPYGMRELVDVIEATDETILPPSLKADLRRRSRVLGLWYGAKFLANGRRAAFERYWQYARTDGASLPHLAAGMLRFAAEKSRIRGNLEPWRARLTSAAARPAGSSPR